MLTGDLVRARARGGAITPGYVDPDKVVERADALVALLREAVEARWPRGRVDEAIDDWVGASREHKMLRGLAKVALDRSEFETAAAVDPVALRQEVFTEARRMGPLALERGPLERPVAEDVLEVVAARHGVSADRIADALYADLQEAQRLQSCAVPDGGWLVDRYNVALVQALLLKATELRVRLVSPTVPRMRQLFRQVKFHQLLYRAEREGDALELVLDGPISMFRSSTRYGMQLANFLPALLLQDGDWTAEATVLWTKAKHERTLALSSKLGLRSHYRDRGAYATREQQWFAERWEALDAPWAMTDGQEPIHLGGRAVIYPDFTFERDGRKAHLDIVGFWRRDYLERRLALLEEYGPGNLVVAVSRKLRGSKENMSAFSGEVVEFAEIVPAKKVLEAVERVAR